GIGVDEILEAIVARVPPPGGDASVPLQALVFDSHYDPYKGVVAYVRVANGTLHDHERIRFMATEAESEILELGYFRPQPVPTRTLVAGEVGYVATGLKSIREARVGDTLTSAGRQAAQPLPGYKRALPLVFAGIYPLRGDDYPLLRDALDKLHLNDARFVYEPETSVALGFGFRCGFLGLLHMRMVELRLERELGLELIARVREPGLQVHRLSARRSRQARCAGERGAGRRPEPHRPPLERIRRWQDPRRAIEGADPATAVRSTRSGGSRLAYHQPRDDPGHPQERARQVLRRGRDAQAKAPRKAEGGEAAHEANRIRRDSAGGLPGGAAHRRVGRVGCRADGLLRVPSPCDRPGAHHLHGPPPL